MVIWTRNDSAIELTPAQQIAPGMWNKLYALVALAREKSVKLYWIYSGTLSVYDVTNRVIEARSYRR